ncbi:MAG: MGMT family protein [Bryobacteraceae bacterium]|nr:MGMT family protein [Bryobacteraceae bacterium]
MAGGKRGSRVGAVVRRLRKAPASARRDAAFAAAIRQIPPGKVATYGQVAAAAGYPLHHRQVVQLLRRSGDALPWQRVVGAGGVIRLRREMAHEQRLRLEMEGVCFRAGRVVMADHQHQFRAWELPR